jgi:hypothetical protein
MATKVWEVVKFYFCEYVGHEVACEAQVVYPADNLPDAPRVIAHRCSCANNCDIEDKANCPYGITDMNPAILNHQC